MQPSQFRQVLKSHPIIVAVRGLADLSEALASPAPVIFLLGGSLAELPQVGASVKAAGKVLGVHIDLLEGVAKDQHGLAYLREVAQFDAIITTRLHLIQAAKQLGVGAVQRVFILDSQSEQTGLEMAREHRPDVVEMLPGLMPSVVRRLSAGLRCPLITGGLIESPRQVARALAAGAVAVSTSAKPLWQLSTAELSAQVRGLVKE